MARHGEVSKLLPVAFTPILTRHACGGTMKRPIVKSQRLLPRCAENLIACRMVWLVALSLACALPLTVVGGELIVDPASPNVIDFPAQEAKFVRFVIQKEMLNI